MSVRQDSNGKDVATATDTIVIDEAREAFIKGMLDKQKGTGLSEFMRAKLVTEAAKNWDLFYKNNATNFFKDRHWTEREFQELRETGKAEPNSTKLLEIGCGVGNFVFPLLQSNKELFIYACDFSSRAVDHVKASEHYDTTRTLGFVCDITKDDLSATVPAASLDLVSAIYVLSAIPPSKFADTIANIRRVLKPGGIILFRDYGLYDFAQLRFRAENRLDDKFYVRSDGTFTYYFSLEDIATMFEAAGFDVLENVYITKEFVNRKENLRMDRIFVQARLQKRADA
ncbi:S-adenosyl-L-methionine-dependent methyltransferase [Entophlyctis helioformis]|nr:S-adenosyl-L-methionine-dependent methyltransferase [Entophlyctis helioformis]